MNALPQTEFLARLQQVRASFPEKKAAATETHRQATHMIQGLQKQTEAWAESHLATVASAIIETARHWPSNRYQPTNWPEGFSSFNAHQALEGLLKKLGMEHYLKPESWGSAPPYVEWYLWQLPLDQPKRPELPVMGPAIPLTKAFESYFQSIRHWAQYDWDTDVPDGETLPRWRLRQQRLQDLAETNLANAQQLFLTFYDRQLLVLHDTPDIHLSLIEEKLLPAELEEYEYGAYCQQLAKLLGPAFTGGEEMEFPMRHPDYVIRANLN